MRVTATANTAKMAITTRSSMRVKALVKALFPLFSFENI